MNSRLPSWIRTPLIELGTLIKRDLPRVLIMSLLGALMLQPDAATWTLIRYSFGLGVFLVVASHVMRRLLFPRIDLQALIESAQDNRNLPAAICAIALCAVLIAVMFIMAKPFFN